MEWVTIPREPTEEMLLAAFKQAVENLLSGEGSSECKTDEERSAKSVRPLYAAMIAAAPAPSADLDPTERERVMKVLEPFARADRAMGMLANHIRVETEKGYREMRRDDFTAARALLDDLRGKG